MNNNPTDEAVVDIMLGMDGCDADRFQAAKEIREHYATKIREAIEGVPFPVKDSVNDVYISIKEALKATAGVFK